MFGLADASAPEFAMTHVCPPFRPLTIARSVALCLLAAAPAVAQSGLPANLPPGLSDILQQIRERVVQGRVERRTAALAVMGYNMIPSGSASAVQISRGVASDGSADTRLVLGQFGDGATISDDVPIFVEGYIGYARYDPRFVGSGGQDARRLPLRWNNLSATVGVGVDIRLAPNLFLRPILNGAAGVALSDEALAQAYVNWRYDQRIRVVDRTQLNAWAAGGSLTLAYYDYRPARDIDAELRYTELHLRTFGSTVTGAPSRAEARSLSLWTRYREQTGLELFGGPIRWVAEFNGSLFLGDQRRGVGFNWATQFGGGIELDIGRLEIGALGFNVTRLRVLSRYLYADRNVRGVSIGAGLSF
jgi:hypothetical protein